MAFLEMLPLLVTFLAWVGGGVVSVVTGFGCGLFAMPIMLLCVPTETAIPVNCVLCCIAMSLILVKFWRAVDWKHFFWMTLVGIPGAFLGVYVLTVVPVHWIELGFGVFLLVSAGWEFLRKRISRANRYKPGWPLELFLAFVAGAIDGIIGMGGPAMAVYATLANWDKDMARGTFGIFFGLNLTLCTYLQYKSALFGPAELELIMWAVPGAVLGTFLGIPVAGWIKQETFMKLLLLVIAISGFVLIGKGLG